MNSLFSHLRSEKVWEVEDLIQMDYWPNIQFFIFNEQTHLAKFETTWCRMESTREWIGIWNGLFRGEYGLGFWPFPLFCIGWIWLGMCCFMTIIPSFKEELHWLGWGYCKHLGSQGMFWWLMTIIIVTNEFVQIYRSLSLIWLYVKRGP
jgi:hypothetical protein